MANTTDWTPAMIEELTRLWIAGTKTKDIAEILGVTKNAIIGKAHRLELPPRESPIRRSGGPIRKPAKPSDDAIVRPAAVRKSVARVIEMKKTAQERPRLQDAGKVSANPFAGSTVDEKRPCSYPLWDDRSLPSERGRLYCARPSVSGRQYCIEHAGICLVRPRTDLTRTFASR